MSGTPKSDQSSRLRRDTLSVCGLLGDVRRRVKKSLWVLPTTPVIVFQLIRQGAVRKCGREEVFVFSLPASHVSFATLFFLDCYSIHGFRDVEVRHCVEQIVILIIIH